MTMHVSELHAVAVAVEADTDRERNLHAKDAPPRWELVECTCPDYCERDHERD